MTKIFTKTIVKEKRRHLRHNLTRAEAILWNHIKQKQISGQRFLRQFSIGNFIVDFYCPNLYLTIEVDGDTHLSDEEKEYDLFRQKKIEKLGISFLRFTNGEIYEGLDWVIESIETKVKELKQMKEGTPLPPFR